MEIADLTESIKKRHPELRELNPQDFATTIDQLWDNLFKDMISTIVISLNTMVWKYNDDLLENTNQAQLFAERWNYKASFNLIWNVCNCLQHYALSESENWAIWNIFEQISYLERLLFKDNVSLTIWTSSVNVGIVSILSRKILIFTILEYWTEIGALRKWLDEFIAEQLPHKTAKIL